jgi:hypothetical protein
MLVGGEAFHDIQSDAPFIDPSNTAVMLMPPSTENCYSNVSPIDMETAGNVGKTL